MTATIESHGLITDVDGEPRLVGARCDACGTAQPRWHLVCPACHAQARMSWTTGATRPALAIEGPG